MKAIPAAGTALLLIDVINDFAFEDNQGLVAAAEGMIPALATLKRAAAAAGVPVIYVNDNFGRWRSDFQQTVAHCSAKRSAGRRLAQALKPTKQDYFVLKPKHSGFHGSALDELLGDLQVRRLILAGVAGNICVLFTAHDAYMRGFQLILAADCIVSNSVEENATALRQMQTVMKGRAMTSGALRFRKRSLRPPRG